MESDNLKIVHPGVEIILTCSFDDDMKIWKEDQEEEGEYFCV